VRGCGLIPVRCCSSKDQPNAATVSAEEPNTRSRDQLLATWIELAIRLGVLALLLYWSFVLVQPFITIAIWSVVLTVALYPVYQWIVDRLGGRRRLAAALLTLLNLLIVIAPATWLALGLIDSLRTLSDQLDLTALALPPPPETIRGWPLIGEPIYQFWSSPRPICRRRSPRSFRS
jgi:predicted PurR-regulated permease PerM